MSGKVKILRSEALFVSHLKIFLVSITTDLKLIVDASSGPTGHQVDKLAIKVRNARQIECEKVQ